MRQSLSMTWRRSGSRRLWAMMMCQFDVFLALTPSVHRDTDFWRRAWISLPPILPNWSWRDSSVQQTFTGYTLVSSCRTWLTQDHEGIAGIRCQRRGSHNDSQIHSRHAESSGLRQNAACWEFWWLTSIRTSEPSWGIRCFQVLFQHTWDLSHQGRRPHFIQNTIFCHHWIYCGF